MNDWMLVRITTDPRLLDMLASCQKPCYQALATAMTVEVMVGSADTHDDQIRVRARSGDVGFSIGEQFLDPTPEEARQLGITRLRVNLAPRRERQLAPAPAPTTV